MTRCVALRQVGSLTSGHAAGLDCFLIQVIKRLVDHCSFCRILDYSAHVAGAPVFRKRRHVCSEEVGLAHDTHELILGDLTIAIAVGLFDHLLDLIVSHVLT